jgi:uncharacterized protein (DUF1015 family)
MVKVIPFKGFRYDESVVGELSKVVAPPYDVMKGSKLDMVQALSPNNIAWVTKNKPQDDDTQENNQYSRARDILNGLIAEGMLKEEDTESFYVYGQNFTVHGKDHFRFGFIGLLELEEFASSSSSDEAFSGVLQHEETLPKDIEDRLNLSRNTLAQFGQIFVIYPDHEKSVDTILEKSMAAEPLMDVVDHQQVKHRLWKISDPVDVAQITDLMKNKYLIIADGHHRYKTALALNKERGDLAGSRYRMLTFVNMANTGLVILPTHRLVQNLEVFEKEDLLAKLRNNFTVLPFKTQDEMFGEMNTAFEHGRHALGLYMNDGNYYSLTLNNIEVMKGILPDRSVESQELDVSILHAMVLDGILGIDKTKLAQGTMKGGGYVVYIKGIGDAVDEAIGQVNEGAQAVFFMNPTRIEEVEAVATNFESMPQKSTFFYPKVWTGFTINLIK